MEERLDKLISLIEIQNKAWDKCLQLLLGINEVLTAKMHEQQLLLEEHPPVRQQSDRGEAPPPFNVFSDAIPYGTELESERAGASQSFPPDSTTAQPQDQPEETRQQPEAATVTSKAEMLEQVEKNS